MKRRRESEFSLRISEGKARKGTGLNMAARSKGKGPGAQKGQMGPDAQSSQGNIRSFFKRCVLGPACIASSAQKS